MSEDDISRKVAFFVSPPESDKQTVDIVLMLTEEGWEYVKTAQTVTLDLEKLGVPLRVILSGCRDKEEAMTLLEPFLDKESRKL